MKIAFLKPPIGGILGLEMLTFVEPLGPISIAGGLLAAGHEVRVFDLRIEGEEQGMALCREFAPDLVGLQCNFTTERYRTLRLAERVRRELPEAFVLVGGHDASREPGWFVQPSIDAVAIGDGEEVMPPLTDALERGAGADDIDERIDRLEETLRLTSICGLGQVALGPVMSVLRLQRTPTAG